LPENLYSRLDPLVGLAATVASRAAMVFWAVAFLTIVLTMLFGRAWCGWLCPLGTLLDLVPARRAKLPRLLADRRWRLGKYALLAFVLVAALVGRLGPMVFDPITIVTRPLQELARPFVGTDSVGQGVGSSIARSAIQSVALLSLLPLAAVLALNALGRRSWCRSLCPLGGLLALISKVPGVRRVVDAEACIACGRCTHVCPTDAIDPAEAFASSAAECTVCMRCVDECPKRAIAFHAELGQLLAPGYRPDRREALAGVGAVGLSLAAVMLPLPSAEAEILRPPSTDDKRLSELCVRCGACYSACPTGALRPSVSVTSVAGPWTPMLDVRPVHCTLNCNRCARVCPTDALHTPTPAEAEVLGLGVVAGVDQSRCRAWARGHECMLCQAPCPISGALVGIDRASVYPDGPSLTVPKVNTELCVGCGQCTAVCAVHPAAIVVGPPPPPLYQG
jgi:polyferredoxin